jgi:hypothetical protein
MKKISLLFVGVLFCTLVFANGTDEPIAPTSSSVAVTNLSGSSLFKLYYSAYMAGDVRVTILNQSEKIVFTEKMRKTDGFIRPYNFEGLAVGDYTIQIENREGKHVEKIHYNAGKIEKLINIVKLTEEGKYLLSVSSKSADHVNVNIYNAFSELIHSESRYINRDFAEVINLKGIDAFTIEVTDSKGLLKTLKY